MKAFLIFAILLVSFLAQAQMNVIILKNGSEIKGVVLEETTESIKLKTKDGSIWVFKKSEVEEVKAFKAIPDNTGYFGRMTFGALGGSEISANMTIVNGYKINEHWGLGIGLGLESFYGRAYVPLFLEGEYSLFKKGSTPFVSAGFGYDVPFAITDNNRGGFLAQGLLGFKHSLGDHFGIVTGVGFRYGQLQVENWSWWSGGDGSTKTIYEINRFDIRFGFIFR